MLVHSVSEKCTNFEMVQLEIIWMDHNKQSHEWMLICSPSYCQNQGFIVARIHVISQKLHTITTSDSLWRFTVKKKLKMFINSNFSISSTLNGYSVSWHEVNWVVKSMLQNITDCSVVRFAQRSFKVIKFDHSFRHKRKREVFLNRCK